MSHVHTLIQNMLEHLKLVNPASWEIYASKPRLAPSDIARLEGRVHAKIPEPLAELFQAVNGVDGLPEERLAFFIPGFALYSAALMVRRFEYDGGGEDEAFRNRWVFMGDWSGAELYCRGTENGAVYIDNPEVGIECERIYDSVEALLRTSARCFEENLYFTVMNEERRISAIRRIAGENNRK